MNRYNEYFFDVRTSVQVCLKSASQAAALGTAFGAPWYLWRERVRDIGYCIVCAVHFKGVHYFGNLAFQLD